MRITDDEIKPNLKEKFPYFAMKKVQNHFLSMEFCQVTHLQDIRKFRSPVMIVNLKKRKKHSKIFKTIANFNKILIKIVK